MLCSAHGVLLSGTKFAQSQPWSLAIGWQGPGDSILHPRKDATYQACYNTIILTAEVLALRLGLETETTRGDWRRRANIAKLVILGTEHQEVRTYACSQHIYQPRRWRLLLLAPSISSTRPCVQSVCSACCAKYLESRRLRRRQRLIIQYSGAQGYAACQRVRLPPDSSICRAVPLEPSRRSTVQRTPPKVQGRLALSTSNERRRKEEHRRRIRFAPGSGRAQARGGSNSHLRAP